jgi:Ca2+-binding EF-hand superfamily protein
MDKSKTGMLSTSEIMEVVIRNNLEIDEKKVQEIM